MKKIALISSVALFAPFVAFAQPIPDAGPAIDLLFSLTDIVSAALPIVVSLAVLLFLWGLVKYMTSADDVEKRKESRGLMMWGIVIIFVMISLWGLVNFLGGLFGLDNAPGVTPGLPE